jgi:hypothetical protein
MYNTSFLCTYNLLDNIIDNNVDNENDDYDIRDDLYRSQILQAFNLKEWNIDIMDNVFEYVNQKLINDEKGKCLLEKMKYKSIIPIKDMELMLLFSYDYFYLFHNCLIDLFNNNCISEKNYNLLIEKIENN